MATDPGWARTGRVYAWLGAEGFVVGAVVLLLLNLGVAAPPGSGLSQYVNSTWLVVLGSAFLLLGMLAIIPVGLTLRELLGRGVGSELIVTFFVLGGLLGITSRLLLIPIRLSLVGLAGTKGLQPQVLSSVMLTYSVVENATNWLLYGWFLLTGLALYHASRAAMQQAALPRAWGWLGLAAAIGCWLVVLLTLAVLVVDLPALSLAGRLSMAAVGAVLIPAWLTWLGRELGVTLSRDRAATDGQPEGRGGRRARPGLLGQGALELRPETGQQAN